MIEEARCRLQCIARMGNIALPIEKPKLLRWGPAAPECAALHSSRTSGGSCRRAAPCSRKTTSRRHGGLNVPNVAVLDLLKPEAIPIRPLDEINVVEGQDADLRVEVGEVVDVAVLEVVNHHLPPHDELQPHGAGDLCELLGPRAPRLIVGVGDNRHLEARKLLSASTGGHPEGE